MSEFDRDPEKKMKSVKGSKKKKSLAINDADLERGELKDNRVDADEQVNGSVRDLVMSAGSLLLDLESPPPEPAEAPISPQPTQGGSIHSVEWQAETRDLEFVEPSASDCAEPSASDCAEPSASDVTEHLTLSDDAIENQTLERFEALARRVAETVGLKEKERSADIFAENVLHEQAPAIETASVDGADASADSDAGAEPANADEQTEFIEQDQVSSIIESLLFSTDKPVSIATIKQIFKNSNIRTKDVQGALEGLASLYASPRRGVTLEEINGGYQLRSKSDNADYLRRLAKVRPFRLSGPALEVMSIVAYKQPVTKHEIDEIRGVESGHLLRALMERGLISFGGKSDLPGKPMTYGSTRKFLEIFGLRNIRELPTLGEIDELLPDGIGESEEEKETLSDISEQMSQQFASSYSEGEEELEKISVQLKSVDTTSEFFEQEKVRERERKDRERAQDIRERLVLGDLVESKDQRWFDRYEAKLLDSTTPSDPIPVSSLDIVKELKSLSDEASAQKPGEGQSEDHAEMEFGSEHDNESTDDEGGDLNAHPLWDDDHESGKGA